MATEEKARFDTRLTKKQKQLFEKATQIGGYRSLTDFVVLTVQEKAQQIIAENEQILASENDGQIFFDAITNPPKANKKLVDAMKDYNKLLSR